MKVLEVRGIRKGLALEGAVLEVPEAERHGGWARRPWKIAEEDAAVVWENCLGRVRLTDSGCLDEESLRWLGKWTGGFLVTE